MNINTDEIVFKNFLHMFETLFVAAEAYWEREKCDAKNNWKKLPYTMDYKRQKS